ncbi:MAG: hypothetical protein JST92_04180, partial [Deltaproteobacteria bacterium]|nr:hypothetical protein [Deltaproteobacteria bacterium]
MLYFRHRVNEAAGLSGLARPWGVEIDLRSSVAEPGHLHLAHDPWKRGESFEAWLSAFRAQGLTGPVILNTKEDGLEERALALCAQAGVSSLLFLDTALPTLVKWVGRGAGDKFFVRVSRDEPVEAVQAFRGKVRWAWVDCFGGEPMPASVVASLRPDFNLCLVSPELQGRPIEEV